MRVEHKPKQKVTINIGKKRVPVLEFYRLKYETPDSIEYRIRGVFLPEFEENIQEIPTLFSYSGIPSSMEQIMKDQHEGIETFLRLKTSQEIDLEPPYEYFEIEINKEEYEGN